MCRHFGYLGEPVPLAALVLQPQHSLVVQAATPKDMRGGGSLNADGFGLGWFVPDSGPSGAGPRSASASRYRRPVPIWQDAAFAELARYTVASAVLGAVRNATVGMPVAEAACAPFTDGRWLFSLNGRIAGWPDSAVGLAGQLSGRELLTMDALTDAALLWALLKTRLAASVLDPAEVLGELVADVLAAAPGSRLNTLLTDGHRIYATTVTHSLWYRHTADGVLVASEAFEDDPGWVPVADSQLLRADRSGVQLHELPESRPDGTFTRQRKAIR